MTPHLGLQRIMIPSSQVSSLTTGSITLPSAKGSFYDGPYGAYDSLANFTVGSTAVSSITFSGIPTGYKHLQIRMLSRTSLAGTIDGYTMRMNGDSTTTYPYHITIGSGSAASSVNDTAQTFINNGDIAGANATAGIFGVAVIDILDYASTTKLKTTRTLVGVDTNGGGSVRLISGLYRSLTPISLITFASVNGANFTEYSSFALYGVK
jgi:hypothetical protein